MNFVEVQLPERTGEAGWILRHEASAKLIAVVFRPAAEPGVQRVAPPREIRASDPVEEGVRRLGRPLDSDVVASPAIEERC